MAPTNAVWVAEDTPVYFANVRTSSMLAGCMTWSFVLLLAVPSLCFAEDIVVYRADKDRDETTRKSGTIEDYTAFELTLVLATGRTTKIDSHRIVRIETPKTKPHVQADELFATHKYSQANVLYGKALNEDPREWMRRQIIAQQVRCLQNAGEHDKAAERFVSVLATSEHFHVIPLAWSPRTLSGAAEARAQQWLGHRDSSVRLLGASWLLTGHQQATAIAMLRQLSTSTNRRVALLAESQMWRTQVVTARTSDVQRWQSIVGKLPTKLRAGPLFVIASAQERLGPADQTALAFMKLPVLYRHQRELAARSLLSAGRALTETHPSEAIRIYQEMTTHYQDSQLTALAQQRLQAIKDRQTQ